jgi:ACT domain-containing protein
MVSVKKFIRQNQALQVIQHSNNGMSIVKACQEVGIPRSSFYDIVDKSPEAIAEYQEMVEVNPRRKESRSSPFR